MGKSVHSRPVSEEDETLSCSKKPRFEASPSSENMEKYTIFTDTKYKLPLYLSEFALSVFNDQKNTNYEKVNVVETMKSLDVVKGTTYLVTFEASLPNKSNNAKTFQTNLFMSTFPLEPTAKITLKFVRMKPSGFDYNGEEESEEKVSESKEEGSEVEVSAESDEEDSKEKLSDESGEEKSDISESKEEGSEEDISESNEEDSEEEPSDVEDEEEKLPKSDQKDTDRKLGRRKIVGRRKSVGGKAPRIQLAFFCAWTYDPESILCFLGKTLNWLYASIT